MQQWSLDFLSFLCGLIINWWWGFNHCGVRWSICDLVKCLVASSVWRPFARYLMHKFYIPTCQGKVFGAQHICRRKHIFNLQQHLEGEIFLLYIWCWKIFISSAIVKCLLLMWHWAMSCDKFPVSVKVTSATLVQGKSRLAHSHRRAILIVRCLFKWPAASFALLRFSISL